MVQVQERLAFWDTVTAVTILVAIAATIFCLTHGITDVFPFLYFLPIILFVCFHPSRGVIFTLLLSAAFIFLVYYFGISNPLLVAVATGWFAILVVIGVVTSSFASDLRTEEKKFRQIFENSQAGTFTLDCGTLVIQATNEQCARLLHYARADLVGRELSAILPDTVDRDRFIRQARSGIPANEVELLFHTQDGEIRHFLATASVIPENAIACSVIDVTERRIAERVIRKARDELEIRVKERTEALLRENEVLRAEIEERRHFEEAIQLANRKLNTLANITRHDILNQITALDMYLNLAQEKTTNAAVKNYLERIFQITQLIQKQIRFTRDYQNIGTLAPSWQDVQGLIRSTVADLTAEGVEIETEFDPVEIYADMLLPKVFFNLIENSLRHGGKVTRIRFFVKKDPAGLTIVCEDDGVGIPAEAKEKIFRREFFRNTGYGLFLVTEILSITGITIAETGVPGEGARFEIHVPPGMYRFIGDRRPAGPGSA